MLTDKLVRLRQPQPMTPSKMTLADLHVLQENLIYEIANKGTLLRRNAALLLFDGAA